MADFFSISSESKFDGGLPKKSSRSHQPLLVNLLETISPLKMPILKFASKHQWRIYQKCLLREGLHQKSLNSETELFVVKLPLPNVSANTTESSSQCLYFRHKHAAQPGQWQGWEVKDKNAAIFIIASAALQSALYLLLLHSHHLDIVALFDTFWKFIFSLNLA